MSRREMRRRPVTPPDGFHWEVGSPKLSGYLATYWLVADGLHVDEIGFYTPKGSGPSDAIPMPYDSCQVKRESDVQTATRRLLTEIDGRRQRDARRKALPSRP